ncbi:MAG: ABC transporter ATP-binding protein, partial [Tannerella sp.]|nr:ABC transporter ATP-binding protein [Tannerella sp.]
MIRLIDIRKSYRTACNSLHVLKGINLSVEKGEMISIMGSSGSGKSTLLNILGILDACDSGEYYLSNMHMLNLNDKQAAYYRNKMIGFVFQSAFLIPNKTALDNVALPLLYQKINKRKRNLVAMDYLERMGLKSWSTHFPNELSGGQRQRVAIARALICNPQVILADEPTGQLDSVTSLEILNVLQEINRSGITIIIVTHEKDIAESTDRIVVLHDGICMN